jgi:hypothetical protein
MELPVGYTFAELYYQSREGSACGEVAVSHWV